MSESLINASPVDRFNDFFQAMTGIPNLIEEHDNMPEHCHHCAISDQWYTNDAAVILVDPSSINSVSFLKYMTRKRGIHGGGCHLPIGDTEEWEIALPW